MKPIYFSLLLLTSLLFSCEPQQELSPKEKALRKAATYLWSQQKEDGSWRSEQYAVVKGGCAYTSFVLLGLNKVPNEIFPAPESGVEKALDFIRSKVDNNGVIGLGDSLLMEYPNYSTAYGLNAMASLGTDEDQELVHRMLTYLLDEQFDESRGFGEDSLVYGAWGFGETDLPMGVSGHVDLSHTRRVLQALVAADHSDRATYEKTIFFLRILQKHAEAKTQPAVRGVSEGEGKIPYDGGFYYSPVVLGANKGREEEGTEEIKAHYKSYATATCDGILALLAAGQNVGEEPISSAIQWLKGHPMLERPEGIPEDDLEPWYLAVHYYHIMVRAEVYNAVKFQGNWQGEIFDLLIKEQKEDGSFVNEYSSLMKEDDPILATAQSVIAMVHCLD